MQCLCFLRPGEIHSAVDPRIRPHFASAGRCVVPVLTSDCRGCLSAQSPLLCCVVLCCARLHRCTLHRHNTSVVPPRHPHTHTQLQHACALSTLTHSPHPPLSAACAVAQYGSTPLHFAAQNGKLEVAALLLEKGAAVEAKNNVRSHNTTRQRAASPLPAPLLSHTTNAPGSRAECK